MCPQHLGLLEELLHRRDPRPPHDPTASGAFPMWTPGSVPCVWAQLPTQRAVSAAAGSRSGPGTFGKAATSWRGRVWHHAFLAFWGLRVLGQPGGPARTSASGRKLGADPHSNTPCPVLAFCAPFWSGPGPSICAHRLRSGDPDRGKPELAQPARLPGTLSGAETWEEGLLGRGSVFAPKSSPGANPPPDPLPAPYLAWVSFS